MAVHIVLFLKLFNKKHRKVDFFHKKNCILVALLSAKLLMPQKYLKIKNFLSTSECICVHIKKGLYKGRKKGVKLDF